MTMTGSCLCGSVKFEITGEPIFIGSCYCVDCQKESGSGHLAVIAVPDAAATVTGAVKSYSKPGASGKAVKRSFCANCGTTVFGQPEMMQGTSMFRAGTLDKPSTLAVSMAIYCADATPWDQPPAGIPHYPGMPGPPE